MVQLEGDVICPKCGQTIPRDVKECPRCAGVEERWNLPREAVIPLSVIALILLFVATLFASRAYHAKLNSLGAEWYAKGEEEATTNHNREAAEDFRTALVYHRDEPSYQLRLAQALLALNQKTEALTYLESLRDREPEDGTVNLELGRLAAENDDVTGALRYYHNAIYGEWDAHPETHRRAARLELAQFLLRKGARTEAQGELIALAAELPRDARLHDQVGEQLLKAGDYDHALQEFQQSLGINPREEQALADAGEATFGLGDYRSAERYFSRAAEQAPKQPQVEDRLHLVRSILALDPSEAWLPASERRRRVIYALNLAQARLDHCAAQRGMALETNSPPSDFKSLSDDAKQFLSESRKRAFQHSPELDREMMVWVSNAEALATKDCGAPTGHDLALTLILKQNAGRVQ